MANHRRVWIALVAMCTALVGTARAQDELLPAKDDPAWSLCANAAAQVEMEEGIPTYLLKAVALTETGRGRGPGAGIASWPWTVHDGSRGYYFPTKEAAIAFVREIRTDGRRSVDVGCMQVNLKHHPRAFTSVAEGFDPLVNIRYGAQFLKQLHEGPTTWAEAVARYHSYNPEFVDYAVKVIGFWQKERQLAALAPRHAPQMRTALAAPRPQAPVLLASAELPLRRETVSLGNPAEGVPAVPAPAQGGTKRLLAWPH